MAKDDKNIDKEEDDFFGDDDDFGLPELDYEALGEDDDDDLDEEMEDMLGDDFGMEEESFSEESFDEMDTVGDTAESDQEQTLVEETEEESVVESDSTQEEVETEEVALEDSAEELIDDTLNEESFDDLSDEDLEAELDGEVSDEEMDSFYEEETFDEFAATEEVEKEGEIPDSVFDSDVLDEEEFKEFEQDLMSTEEAEASSMSQYAPTDDKPKGKFTKVVVFGIVGFAILGAAFFFGYRTFFGDDKGEEVAEKQQKAKQIAAKEVKKKPTPAKKEGDSSEAAKAPAGEGKPTGQKQAPKTASKKAAAKKPAAKQKPATVAAVPGAINTLSEKTGNLFIIIGSFVDEDIANDYAVELATAGKSPSIIPPFGNAVTYRVAIKGYASLSDAKSEIDDLRPEFGQDIWILRY